MTIFIISLHTKIVNLRKKQTTIIITKIHKKYY